MATRLLTILVVMLGLACLATAACDLSQADAPRHVVLISVDTLRADRLSV